MSMESGCNSDVDFGYVTDGIPSRWAGKFAFRGKSKV